MIIENKTTENLRLLVTGSNGFIGNNLLAKLMATDPGVLHPRFSGASLDILGTDLPDTHTRATAQRFAGSVRYHFVDADQLFVYMEKNKWIPHCVVHNGACSSTTEQNWAVFEKLNINSSKDLWDFCQHYTIPFLYASSASVYGSGEHGFSDKKEDMDKYTALNLYGKSKLDFDRLVLSQAHKTPPTWFGLRYFNVFGPFESHKGGQASMVFHGYNQAIKNKEIRLFKSNTPRFTDGNQERDFVWVGDVVDITLALMKIAFLRQEQVNTHPLQDNGCFVNIGQGVANTWNSLATHVFEALGLPTRIVYMDMPKNLEHQYQNHTCAQLQSLHMLGIKHTFKSLQEGVFRYVQKHLTRGQ